MGPHSMNRPPNFVQGFIDRHGKPRFYFRRPGFKSVPLPGLPWSPEFMAVYVTAMAGQPAPIGAATVKSGLGFMQTPELAGFRRSTSST